MSLAILSLLRGLLSLKGLDHRKGLFLGVRGQSFKNVSQFVHSPGRAPDQIPRLAVEGVGYGLKHGLGIGEAAIFQVRQGPLCDPDPFGELYLAQAPVFSPCLDVGRPLLFLRFLRHSSSVQPQIRPAKRVPPIISA